MNNFDTCLLDGGRDENAKYTISDEHVCVCLHFNSNSNSWMFCGIHPIYMGQTMLTQHHFKLFNYQI